MMWEVTRHRVRKKQKQAQEGTSVSGKGVGLYVRGSDSILEAVGGQ